MASERTTADRLAMWKDMTAHVIAIILTLGFFGIVFVAVLGLVKLDNPTTATFIGTTAGYAIGQLARPLSFYFGMSRTRQDEKDDVGAGLSSFGGR